MKEATLRKIASGLVICMGLVACGPALVPTLGPTPTPAPVMPVGVCGTDAGAPEKFQAPVYLDNFKLNDTPEHALISKIADEIDKSSDAALEQKEWREFAVASDMNGQTVNTVLAALKFYEINPKTDAQMDELLKKSWEKANLQTALRGELTVIKTEKTKPKGKADAFASADYERIYASPSADVVIRLLHWKYCTEAKLKGIDYETFVAQTMKTALEVSVAEAKTQQAQMVREYFGKNVTLDNQDQLLKSALNIGSGAFELPDEKVRLLMADEIFQRLMQRQPDVVLNKLWTAGPSFELQTEKKDVLLAFCRLLTKDTEISRFPFILDTYMAAEKGKPHDFGRLIDNQKVFFPGEKVTLEDLNRRSKLIPALAEQDALIHPSGKAQHSDMRVSYGRIGSATDLIKQTDEIYYVFNLDETLPFKNSDKYRFQLLGFQWVRDEKQTLSRKFVPVALVRRLEDDKIPNETLAIYPTDSKDLTISPILNMLNIDFQRQGVWTKPGGVEKSRLLPFISLPAGEFIYDPLYLMALK